MRFLCAPQWPPLLALVLSTTTPVAAWLPASSSVSSSSSFSKRHAVAIAAPTTTTLLHGRVDDDDDSSSSSSSSSDIFMEFATFLQDIQREIIREIEEMDGSSGATFTNDTWGVFAQDNGNGNNNTSGSGGITRVLQGGDFIEKGACSLTLIRQGILTAERAAAIRARSRQDDDDDDDDGDNNSNRIQAGDVYSAAALSMVLHSRSPMVPTFRSDVRIFLVQQSPSSQQQQQQQQHPATKTNTTNANAKTSMACWFGGGADLTPYYLFEEDVQFFHQLYHDLCQDSNSPNENDNNDNDEFELFSYDTLKTNCDDYFYLPARAEHRGTGGIFFDDLAATKKTMGFVKRVAKTWMPSWLPIVQKRRFLPFTEKQKEWQLLRRGRYLEFNLLYDRGVKFGLANANPRVEGGTF
jgi:coproporphyrinogen III oxidase